MDKLVVIPEPMVGKELYKYFRTLAKPVGNGFYRSFKPIMAFKMAFSENERAIVNLTIPAGAAIFADWSGDSSIVADDPFRPHLRKMRSDVAKVHSIVRLSSRGWHSCATCVTADKVVDSARSDYDAEFRYAPGQTVRPGAPFSRRPRQCESGIHFFLNVGDAIRYT